jgi:hypothetical protein
MGLMPITATSPLLTNELTFCFKDEESFEVEVLSQKSRQEVLDLKKLVPKKWWEFQVIENAVLRPIRELVQWLTCLGFPQYFYYKLFRQMDCVIARAVSAGC